MRMRGEILGYKEEEDYKTEEEEVEVEEREMVGGGLPQSKKFVVVGYALTSKKVKSFLQPKLEGLARSKGILFVAIDQSKPLSDQGPFDIVLHKLSGSKWRRILEVGSFGSFLCLCMCVFYRILLITANMHHSGKSVISVG
ncbi:hypothetical protein RDI58_011694 [Solanum bulbocastanum]|uniref:Inositol-tetrakisphosphate 1-kinase N-terminal domain-containing protein n=1 Tax=Solanum bulbocastanum TaxID=147425 RepID=A0AAN8YKQ8_SOLBU